MNIIIAIIIFGFLILFHELGHFSVAKRCNIKVNEFSLGLGPTLFGVTVGETKYSIKALPLGGACMMEGEDEHSDDDRAFNSKPLWQRFLVVLAGPVFNFILAFILAVIMLGFVGVDKPIVESVTPNYPASEAGIEAGDTIVSINGYHINFFKEISIQCFFNSDGPLDVVYERDGQRYSAKIMPVMDEEYGRALIGVQSSGIRQNDGVISTLGAGLAEIRYQIYVVFKSLGYLVSGHASLNDMAGPVGIVKVIGDTVEESASAGLFVVLMNVISLTILLSANLGVMNLLPIPALDGGRLFLYIIEAIRRKKLDDEVEGKIHFVGFIIVMGLMVFILFNDVRKLIM